MNYIKIFFNQHYQNIKRDFWFLIGLNILGGIALWFFNPHVLIQVGVVGLLGLKSGSFLKNSSILPATSPDVDRYSWKYFQGLPLSKAEIVKALVYSDFLTYTPLLVFFVSFFDQLTSIFDEKEQYYWFESFKYLLLIIPFIFLLGSRIIHYQLIFPRQKYSKNDPRHVFYSKLKSILLAVAMVTWGGILVSWLDEKYDFPIDTIFATAFSVIKPLWNFWSAVILMTALAAHAYFSILRAWQDEKIGYIKINFVPRRDFGIIAMSGLALLFSVERVDSPTPLEFKTPLHKAVYKKNRARIQELISQGQDLNKPNKYGVTPIHVAALKGDLELFKFLEEKGADPKITADTTSTLHIAMNSQNKDLARYLIAKGFDVNSSNKHGNTPLHIASRKCHPALVDLLISFGADVNKPNKKGETSLHFASKSNCFGVVTALIDNKADPLLKNKEGKLALDLVKEKRELGYYLEKKTRAPASQP